MTPETIERIIPTTIEILIAVAIGALLLCSLFLTGCRALDTGSPRTRIYIQGDYNHVEVMLETEALAEQRAEKETGRAALSGNAVPINPAIPPPGVLSQ